MPNANSLLGRRRFLRQTAGAVSAAALAAHAYPEEAPRRPNIAVVTSDQQHWQAFGAADPFFDTPNMDRFAQTGTLFRQAFCTTPQCSPCRASLYTGLYPHRTGVIGNLQSIDHRGQPIADLPGNFETIASRLRAAGYVTACFGKWHLGNHAAFEKHFDVSDLDGDAHGGATDRAVAFLKERTGQSAPFALFVNYINPHDNYDFIRESSKIDLSAPPERPVPHPASWRETFANKPAPQQQFMREDQGRFIYGKPDALWEQYRLFYREKCRLFDAEFGRLAEALDQHGFAGNTAVTLTSDHGDMDTHHRLVFKGPFMYEQLVRVPLIIRLPEAFGGRPAAVDAFAQATDLLPTICELAGAHPGETDGRSLAPWLTGKGRAPERDYVVAQYYNKQKWVNPIRMLRTNTFKYTRCIGHGEELYDLKNDPEELNNLAADSGYAKRKEELAAALRQWMTAHGDTAFDTYWATDRTGARWKG